MNNSEIAQLLLEVQTHGAVAGYDANATFLQFRAAAQQYDNNYTDLQLALYTQAFLEAKYMRQLHNYILAFFRVFFLILGLGGYAAELVVLVRSADLQQLSFTYHRAIAIVEIPTTIGLAVVITGDVTTQFAYTGSLQLSSVIGGQIAYITGLIADTLTMFTCVERVVAIWLPLKYALINCREVVIGAVVVSSVYGLTRISTIFEYTGAYVDAEQVFALNPDYVAFMNTLGIIDIAKSVACVVMAIFISIGLLRQSHKRRQRIKKKQAESEADREAYRTNKQLCYLMFCLTIPMAVNTILYYIDNYIFGTSVDGTAAVQTLPFADAMANAYTEWLNYAVGVPYDISTIVAHTLHFYFYFAFSSRFRKAAVIQLGLRKQSAVVQPVTTKTVS